MGLILEPAIKPAAATQNITLEDFLDQLDRIEPAQTPMTSFCANEVNLKATERSWNVDDYPSPKGAVGRADGQSVTAASSRDWSANMRKMGNIGQGFDEQWGVGWIAEKVPHIAGVKDPLAYAKASAALMLKRHMEVAFSSTDQTAIMDLGPGLGAIGAGYVSLISYGNRYTGPTAYAAGKATDRHYSPTAACYTGTATMTATVSRGFLKTVAKALRTAAQRRTDWMLIAGLSLRQAITDLTEPQSTTAGSTTASGWGYGFATQIKVLTRAEQESTLGTSIDIVQTDFGRIMVTDSDYIGTTTTSSTGGTLSGYTSISGTGAGGRGNATSIINANAGLLIKKGNLFKMWGVAPYSVQLGQDGSGDIFDSKCLAMLGVRSPILGAFWNFTS